MSFHSWVFWEDRALRSLTAASKEAEMELPLLARRPSTVRGWVVGTAELGLGLVAPLEGVGVENDAAGRIVAGEFVADGARSER